MSVLSLAQLVALPLAPPQLLALAAACGCQGAGIRVLPASPGGPFHALLDDAVLRRETLAAQRDTGVQVLDLEIVRIAPGFDAAAFEGLLALGAELGARHVLVAGDEPDEARLTAGFAALCQRAARHGLTCDLEFMPWTAVRDARSALRVVQAAAEPNGGVLVDALHWARSGSTLDDVGAIPAARLHYAQICDGAVPGPSTVEGLIHDARCERAAPGEGGIALQALFARLPRHLPVSIEVPSLTQVAARGQTAWAHHVVAAARAVLAKLPD